MVNGWQCLLWCPSLPNLFYFELFDVYNSIFKQEAKGKYIILSVVFKLTRKNHVLHTNYGAIASELERTNISKPTIQDVSKAVISIRQSKLPDPKEIGNSGSFFKNPIISKDAFLKFQFDKNGTYSKAYGNGDNETIEETARKSFYSF